LAEYSNMKGIAVFFKPQGWTSFDVVNFLKRKLNEKDIGHGGSLDPMAQGVLIVGIGRNATKALSHILKNSKKEYIAEIQLGQESDTYDITGKIQKNQISKFPALPEIQQALEEFKGKIKQTPPRFSAIKISGVPAYKMARNNEEFDIPSKEVELFECEILDYKSGILKMRLVVSSGFYIRSLAHDLGQKLKTGGVLYSLLRTKVDRFDINEAIDIKTFPDSNLEIYFKASGTVQGIGFRNYARMIAKRLHITGKAENIEKDFIEIIGQGQLKDLQKFLDKISNGPPLSTIKNQFFYFRKPQTAYTEFKKY